MHRCTMVMKGVCVSCFVVCSAPGESGALIRPAAQSTRVVRFSERLLGAGGAAGDGDLDDDLFWEPPPIRVFLLSRPN